MTLPEARFDWLSDRRLGRIFDVLGTEGEARLVGGCVRDALLGQSPLEHDAIDIDIATDRTPEEMKAMFDAAGLRWIATGEEHGTLTVVEDGLVAECTTLRADVATDGRHAEVRFTRDWDEDWRRRDFTINALYADRTGVIQDPAKGLKDLTEGRVRFIGHPAERIKEDALRILRFFRFTARFGKGFDSAAVKAIEAHAELLDILSKERVWSELQRTFSARAAPDALEVAARTGVLQRLLPGEPRIDVFRSLHTNGHSSVDLSMVALWPTLSPEVLKQCLKPSNEFLDGYAGLEKARSAITARTSAHELLFRFGRDASLKAAALAAAEGLPQPSEFLDHLHELPIPVMPFGGKDLLSRGIQPGPEVSRLLKAFETAWLDAGAPDDGPHQEQLLAEVLSGEAPR